MKEKCEQLEAKIIAAKGPAYLKALYDREGVSAFRPESLDYLKGQIAALAVEAGRMEGEISAATAVRIAPVATPAGPGNATISAAQALAKFESLVEDAQPTAAAKFWDDNARLLLEATGWADRATSAVDAEQKYMRLVQLGRSYEAGRFWENNRDLLSR
jgi:hypothetical protein